MNKFNNGFIGLNFSSFFRTIIDTKNISIMRTLMNQIIESIKFEGKSLQNDDLKKIKIYENIIIEKNKAKFFFLDLLI